MKRFLSKIQDKRKRVKKVEQAIKENKEREEAKRIANKYGVSEGDALMYAKEEKKRKARAERRKKLKESLQK